MIVPVIQVGDMFHYYPANSEKPSCVIKILEILGDSFKVEECLADGSSMLYGTLNKSHGQEWWQNLDIRKCRWKYVSGDQRPEYTTTEPKPVIIEVLY